ncbi:biogenesis of lysosome-related organelles complex 1 subunit 6-like isoform X1 [Thrips palmi]|uniref:Biogenesis of lysosome-related organelles complex 1 subunit 6 n=1 Tax=Thrips palmi TaxID=161013 RepID=A0A6P8ZQ65_THRPL|nr:biogenesis of lysosome-related organelles complex 1 subunit 6-like isoform X1 [Thrips palmi]
MSAPSNNKLKEQIREILLQHDNYDNNCPGEISNVANEDCLEKLAAGLMTFYEPELKRFREQLAEVVGPPESPPCIGSSNLQALLNMRNKQNTLIEQLQDENKRFVDTQNAEELQGMFVTVKAYQTKLMAVKKDMTTLHDRVTKMKKRALKLQQRKEKQALQRQQQREAQLLREQELVGKPNTSSSKATSPTSPSNANLPS